MIRLHSVFTSVAVVILTASAVCAQNAWLPANGGLVAPVTSLAVNSAGYLFASVTDNGIYRSENNGQSWQALANPSGYTLDHVWCITGQNHIFCGSGYTEFRSTNDGDSWTAVRITPQNSYDPAIVAWTWTPTNRMLIATGTTGLQISINDGNSWSEEGVFPDIYMWPTYVACGPKGTIFATSSTLVDTATGPSASFWASSTVPSGGFGANVNFAFNRDANIVANGSNGVFYSSDNGGTWTKIDQEDNASSYALAIAANGYIFQGASSKFGGATGLKLSIDHGATWNPLTSGLTSTQVYSLQVSWAGYVYAATDSGVFRYMDPTGDVKPVASAVPANFSLSQNYPNPATATTTIRFALPESAPVSMRVYDMAGRELASLANGNYAAGTYSVSFDTHELTSGVYYYQIQAGAFSEARTFVVAP